MATATKTHPRFTVTLGLTSEEAQALREYLGARIPSLTQRIGSTTEVWTALKGVLAPF